MGALSALPTPYGGFPQQRTSNTEPRYLLRRLSEHTVEQTVEFLVIRDAMAVICCQCNAKDDCDIQDNIIITDKMLSKPLNWLKPQDPDRYMLK